MKPKRHFWSMDIWLLLLGAACLTLTLLLVFARPTWFAIVAVVLVAVLALCFIFLRRLRKVLRRFVGGAKNEESARAAGLSDYAVPVAVLEDGRFIWYNNAFRHEIAGEDNAVLLQAAKLVPGFDLETARKPGGQNVAVGERLFTAYATTEGDGGTGLVSFIENTALKRQAAEYQATRPSVLYFVIDTYDEILKEMKESERAQIMSGIDLALERFVGKSSGFLRRVSASKYMAVVEERHIKTMVDARFDILDSVRKSDEDSSQITMSIGVGRAGATLKECEEMAGQALDMALGRGGDQAAVKSPDGYEFYGGVTRSVEKRTKVKSRIIATAIRDLMGQYDKVLIMGHRDSDMDCIGAGVGMLRFCRICKKPAAIVVNREKTLAGHVLAQLEKNGYGEDLISPADAMPLTGPKTLLIIVDTHMKALLESSDVYAACGGVVVIDHHRRMVGHIDDAVIFYHEPYASSASELVTELLQYVGDGRDDKPTPVEAEALLAGIMLDTRTFSLHVGVRTFEASAWLRRMGAQTAAVKKLFASNMNEYLYRSHLVGEAVIHEGCAVAMSDKIPTECEVVAPQAANELLTIEGVDASFVGIKQGDVVRISARSMGEVNVQLVMEKIGGGGHLTMAGAQMKNVSLEDAKKALQNAISEYAKERARGAKNGQADK